MGPQATLDAALDSGQVEVVWTAEGSQGGTPDKSAQQASQAGSCPQVCDHDTFPCTYIVYLIRAIIP